MIYFLQAPSLGHDSKSTFCLLYSKDDMKLFQLLLHFNTLWTETLKAPFIAAALLLTFACPSALNICRWFHVYIKHLCTTAISHLV